jgi:hypothetical protein
VTSRHEYFTVLFAFSYGQRNSIEVGTEINVTDKQSENMSSSMRRRFEIGSNASIEREEPEDDDSLQMISTEDGIQIVFNDEQFENVSSSIR